MTYLDVTTPAPLPWELEDIVARALDVLRLDPTDADAERIELAAVEATTLIEQSLDLHESPTTIPAPVVGAAVQVTIELYRRKDAPFGVTDAWSVDGSIVRLSSDPLKGVWPSISRYRGRWGVA